MVINTNAEAPTLKSMPIVNGILEVFLEVFHCIPPDRVIDFGTDMFPSTKTIPISHYGMAPVELHELKPRLKDLLGKRFYSTKYSLDAQVLFVRKKDDSF